MIRNLLLIIFSFNIILSQPVNIWIPDCEGDSGTTVNIPIRIDSVTGRGVIGVDIILNFRSEVLVAESVFSGNVVPNGWLILFNNTIPNQLNIAMAGAYPLSGEGSLCTLQFRVIGRRGDSTLINFVRCLLNEGNIPATTRNGIFRIPSVEIKEDKYKNILPIRFFSNPFKKKIEIYYELGKGNSGTLTITDIYGNEIILFNLTNTNGKFILNLTDKKGKRLPSGIYFCQLKANNIQIIKKIVFIE